MILTAITLSGWALGAILGGGATAGYIAGKARESSKIVKGFDKMLGDKSSMKVTLSRTGKREFKIFK